MRRAAVLLVVFASFVAPPDGRAQEKPGERVAWFHGVRAAREAAERTGRPVFVALHARAAKAAWPADPEAWIVIYSDPRVVEATREFACVLRVDDASGPQDTPPPPVLLVMSAAGEVRVTETRWPHAPGEPSVAALLSLLAEGARVHGAPRAGAPRIGSADVARSRRDAQGASALSAVPVPIDGPGLRIRLRYEVPVPAIAGTAGERLRGRLLLVFDGQGPFDLGQRIDLGAGEDVDHPVDVRFREIEGLEPLLTEGEHLLEVLVAPIEGEFRFSDRALRIARAWIRLGDGGGGGGGGQGEGGNQPPPQPEPPPAEPPPALAPEGPRPEPPPPEEPGHRTEVVEPFVREGETVKKEGAIVAVPDDEAGTKPPRRVPVEEAVRELEKRLEEAVREERLAPRDAQFLRRYFEALRRRVEPPEPAGR